MPDFTFSYGIANSQDYYKLICTHLFINIERYSQSFLQKWDNELTHITLDTFSGIPLRVAEKLLGSISDRFKVSAKPINLANSENVTTNDFKNTSLLPWKYGFKQTIKNILKGKGPFVRHHLTFYCLTCENN